MERDRSFRRYQAERAKVKARRLALSWRMSRLEWWGMEGPRWIGKMAAVHCKPCSCTGCGNPRRHFGERTLQELKWVLTAREEELS